MHQTLGDPVDTQLSMATTRTECYSALGCSRSRSEPNVRIVMNVTSYEDSSTSDLRPTAGQRRLLIGFEARQASPDTSRVFMTLTELRSEHCRRLFKKVTGCGTVVLPTLPTDYLREVCHSHRSFHVITAS